MSNYIDWSMEGTEFNVCNCNWGCPCQFNGLPSHGHCSALNFVQIDRGHFGDVKLDGVRWGTLMAWPAAIHFGNGTFVTVIDEKATPSQRQAIEAVSHGRETEPGTLIWQVFSTTISKLLPTLYKPIELSIDYGVRKAHLRVPGVAEGNVESIRNPVTGAAHQVRVTMPTGFEFTESEVVSGKCKVSGPIAMDFDGTHAHLAKIHWSTRGVVR